MSTRTADRTAIVLKGEQRTKSYTLERRVGQVTDVDPATGKVTVTIGGDPTPIENISTDSNYVPQVNDVVNIDVKGQEISVPGKVGGSPSVFSGAATSQVNTQQSTTSGSYANLTTVGPAVTVTVSASGIVMLGFSCLMTATNASDGGRASISINGSTPDDAHSIEHFASNADGSSTVSRTMLLTGLTPGSNNFSMKYKTTGTNAQNFENRDLWVLPL